MLRTAMLHANASFASVRALVRLNTGEFLNALRLNDEIRRGVPRTFPACSTRVCFGTSHPHSSVTIIIEPERVPRGVCMAVLKGIHCMFVE